MYDSFSSLHLQTNRNKVTCFYTRWLFSMSSSYTIKVFGMAISTILQCCIADEEMFKGDDRFGEGGLGVMLDQASDHHADTRGGKVAAVEH